MAGPEPGVAVHVATSKQVIGADLGAGPAPAYIRIEQALSMN